MRTIVYTNPNGDSITLGNGSALFGISDIQGLGVPGLNLQSQRAPFQDGVTPIDRLLDPREIPVTGIIMSALDDAYTHRRTMCAVLNPKLGPGTIVYTNDNGSYMITGTPIGPIFANNNSNEGAQKYQVTFYCEDPYWHDVTATVLTLASNTASVAVDIAGDVPSPITVEITGITDTPRLEELTTGNLIEYTGALDARLTVETSFGKKSATIEDVNAFVLGRFGLILTDIARDDANGLWCAIANEGILSSADGLTWTPRLPVLGLQDIAHNNIIGWVAVGSAGLILTSPDGFLWTQQTSGTTESLNSVSFNSTGTICAVGTLGVILTSLDGVTWTPRTSGVTTTLNGVTYGAGLGWSAVGASGVILASTNGITWTSQTISTLTFSAVAFSATLGFCAGASSGEIYTSANNSSWTLRTTLTGYTILNISFSSLLGWYVTTQTNNVTYVSANNTTWTTQSISGTIFDIGVSAADGLLAVGGSTVSSSINGTVWTTLITSVNAFTVNDANYTDEYGWRGTSSGGCLTSADGKSWTVGTFVFSSANRLAVNTNTGFCLASTVTSSVAFSTNFTSWTVTSNAMFANALSIASSPRLGFCIVGVAKSITSPDGINWTEHTTGLSGVTLNKVIWCQEFGYCAAAENGSVYTSPDGATWTAHSTGPSSRLKTISYAPGYGLVAGGESTSGVGLLRYSLDSITWSTVASGLPSTVFGVGYSNELGFLASSTPSLLSSNDGQLWTTVSAPLYDSVLSIQSSPSLGWLLLGNSTYYSNTSGAVNAIASLSADSSFFSLAPGRNVLALSSDSGIAYATVSCRNRYLGV